MIIPLKPIRVMAFDPGETTGVVGCIGQHLTASRVMSKDDIIRAVFNRLSDNSAAVFEVLVAEDFRLYPGKAAALSYDLIIPARILGMLECLAYKMRVPFVLQSAKDAKEVVTDDRLKEYGWWEELHGPHERDAARHALLYLLKNSR